VRRVVSCAFNLNTALASSETAADLLRRSASAAQQPPASTSRLALILGRVIPTNTPPSLLAQAQAAIKVGNLGAAEQACAAFLEANPASAEGWVTMGRVRANRGRFDAAEEAFVKAERIRPLDPQLALARGHLLVRLGRDEEAIARFRNAARAMPREDEPKVMIAACERRLGRPKVALEILAKLPRSATASSIAGWAHLDLGQAKEAEALLRPFITMPVSPVARSQLLHLLGQSYEKLGRFEDALKQYAASKAAIAQPFDMAVYLDRVHRLRDCFTKERLPALAKSSVQSQIPVFIAAMPRSGTTLLERIIAAHPLASGAGETQALRNQVLEFHRTDSVAALIEALPTLTSRQLSEMAGKYLDAVTAFGPEARRIADKHLDNWIFLGFYSRVFPAARAIHIRRDPLDAGISCFERLTPLAVPWSSRLETIGRLLRECDRLMEFWKQNLEIPILTVEYEELVRHPEAQTRRVIEFIGLPWDEACLAHHAGDKDKRLRPPPTLASEQAAKPIHDGSIGRGARFGAALDALRASFEMA
jgi:tetratricopeptide (TPR) repeat protein